MSSAALRRNAPAAEFAPAEAPARRAHGLAAIKDEPA